MQDVEPAPRRSFDLETFPPQCWFLVSAVFHYLGPSFAVLLFAHLGALGVAWLRIASAAVVFAVWRRPWRLLATALPGTVPLLIGLGACLAAMNGVFYLAISRLPLGLVAAIEFIGMIAVALLGARSPRNLAALALAVVGVLCLTDPRWANDPVGLALAAANGALFVVYVLLGHRVARRGAGSSLDRLGLAMLIAFVCILPVGIGQAAAAFASPRLLLAGIGVGICSSVIPYVCDQMAMARLARHTFALMLSLLPAMAVVIGAVVLVQIPSARDLIGLALVMAGVGLHRPKADAPAPA